MQGTVMGARGWVVAGMLGLVVFTPDGVRAQERDRDEFGDRIARAVERALDDLDVRFDFDEAFASSASDGPLVQEEFRWSGTAPAGGTLEIKGVNGPISALPARGDRIEIVALKEGRRNDPSEVRIDVIEHGGGVTLCAVYPSRDADEPNRCGVGEEGRNDIRRNDVRVSWEVRVPAGLAFRGRTVNGGVQIRGMSGAVDVATVNGDLELETGAAARGRTVNGSIHARLPGALRGGADFETVNGSVELDVDDGVDADLDAAWLNGSLDTEIPFRVQGRMGRRSAEGILGDGGPMLRMRTVNGSIRIF